MLYLISILAIALFILAGCSEPSASESVIDDSQAPIVAETEGETEVETEGETEVETEAETEAMPSGATSLVSVELVSFEIRMPATLPAGPTTFEVTNAGEDEHNFEIEGQGIEQSFEANLQPGETQSLEVDLQPGDYIIYCPVGDHREQGMEVTLTVTE